MDRVLRPPLRPVLDAELGNALLGGGGAVAFSPLSVLFDGTNDQLTRGAGLTGATDTKLYTMSVWLKTTASAFFGCFTTPSPFPIGFNCRISGGENIFQSLRNAAGTQIYNSTSVSASIYDGEWHHIRIAVDLANSQSLIAVDGSEVEHTPSTLTDDQIDWTHTNFYIGANQTSNHYPGSMAEVWINNSFVSDVTKFRTAAGKPVDLGADGSGPTGSSPLIFQSLRPGEAVSAFVTNRGTGGGFTEVGALEDGGPVT